MYTLSNLQKELERARNNLREVEDYIQKVDGKPLGTPTLRFYKQERTRFVTQQPWGGEDSQLIRRRPASNNSDEQSPPRKKHASGSDEEESPRKKPFQSVLGEVKLPDLSLSLKRGRERRERQRLNEEGKGGRSSVFARLSGRPLVPQAEEEEEDEEETLLKNQPLLSSRVIPISHPTSSREQVLASQTNDEVLKQRNRRMFGALVGTLQQFRREETQDKEREERRQQIERKLEEDAIKEKERLHQEKKALLVERRKREGDIKRIEWSLNRVKEFAAWETCVLPLKNFIRTTAEPHIFYLPKVHNEVSLQKLEESKTVVQEIIDTRLTKLNEEIEASEKKAKKTGKGAVDGASNGVNKENVFEDNPEQSPGLKGDNDDDEEFANASWEEASAALELEVAKADRIVPDTGLNDERMEEGKEDAVACEEKMVVTSPIVDEIQKESEENRDVSVTDGAVKEDSSEDSPFKLAVPAPSLAPKTEIHETPLEEASGKSHQYRRRARSSSRKSDNSAPSTKQSECDLPTIPAELNKSKSGRSNSPLDRKSKSPSDKRKPKADRSKSPSEIGKLTSDRSKSPTEKRKLKSERSKSPTDKGKLKSNGSKSPSEKRKSIADRSKSPAEKGKSKSDLSSSAAEKRKSKYDRSNSPSENRRLKSRSKSPSEKRKGKPDRSKSPAEKRKSKSKSPKRTRTRPSSKQKGSKSRTRSRSVKSPARRRKRSISRTSPKRGDKPAKKHWRSRSTSRRRNSRSRRNSPIRKSRRSRSRSGSRRRAPGRRPHGRSPIRGRRSPRRRSPRRRTRRSRSSSTKHRKRSPSSSSSSSSSSSDSD